MKETNYHVKSQPILYQAVYGESNGVFRGSTGVRKGSRTPASPDGVPGNLAGDNVGISLTRFP